MTPAFEKAVRAASLAELKAEADSLSGMEVPTAIVRAVLLAIREPGEGMVKRAAFATDDGGCDRCPSEGDHERGWQAMIDHLLAEG